MAPCTCHRSATSCTGTKQLQRQERYINDDRSHPECTFQVCMSALTQPATTSHKHGCSMTTVECAVCGWAQDLSYGEGAQDADICMYSEHFRTADHLQNYIAWCAYREEQDISFDYIDEWLVQNSLVDTHHAALATDYWYFKK